MMLFLKQESDKDILGNCYYGADPFELLITFKEDFGKYYLCFEVVDKLLMIYFCENDKLIMAYFHFNQTIRFAYATSLFADEFCFEVKPVL